MNEFWKATGVRCLRTFLSTLLVCIGEGTLITEVDWEKSLLISISATVVIFITCILGGLPEVKSAEEMTDAEYEEMYGEYEDDTDDITGYDEVKDNDVE